MTTEQELTGPPTVSRVAVLERLTGPDTYWVPQRPGTKVAACTYVWRPLEDTRSAAYRALLEECNLAVYLGAASAGRSRRVSNAASTSAASVGTNVALACSPNAAPSAIATA